jgi:transcriptional regulator with XRE-family HTH domain
MFNPCVPSARRSKLRVEAARRARVASRSIGETFRTVREDAGLPQKRVAIAAGVSQSHYSEIEAGAVLPSLEVLAAIALALGGETSIRFFPGTGPRLRDRTQAAMVEAFLADVHPRWSRFVEVPVYRPAAGVIDLALSDPRVPVVIAAEFHSQLRRLEQQLRWATAKADSLASTSIGALAGVHASIGSVERLLVLRSTHDTRALAVQFERTLATAYPARTQAVVNSITGTAPWPGPGIVWMVVDGARTHLMDGPPRGVRLGR